MARYMKLIVFGDPGIGKTTFIASGNNDARFLPMLFLNFEAGETSIASKVNDITIDDLIRWADLDDNLDPRGPVGSDEFSNGLSYDPGPAGTIDVLRVKSYGVLEDVLAILEQNRLPYKALAVDSITEINYLNLASCTKYNKKMTGKGDGEVPQLQDFLRSGTQMRKLIRSFRDLDMHVLFSALTQDVKDELTGAIQVRPSLTGKLSIEIPAMVNIVAHLSVDNDNPDQRRILFQPRNRIQVKARVENPKALGAEMLYAWDYPILPYIFDVLGMDI